MLFKSFIWQGCGKNSRTTTLGSKNKCCRGIFVTQRVIFFALFCTTLHDP